MRHQLFALPLAAMLIAWPSSKRETCARYAARDISTERAMKQLGIREAKNGTTADWIRVTKFCEYYKS